MFYITRNKHEQFNIGVKMPNIEGNNEPIKQNPIGQNPQNRKDTAGIPTPQNNEEVTPQTDLRNDPLAILGRSAIDVQHPLDPKTKANIQKDIATLNEFLEQNREFADFLIDLKDVIRAKHPDWSQEQVVDLTIQIALELEEQLQSA